MPFAHDAPRGRSRATVLGAFLEGWRRVLGAPALIAGLLLLTMAALPLAVAVRDAVPTHFGSRAVERLLGGWDWRGGGSDAQSSRLASTVMHEILGAGATLAVLSGLADGVRPHPAIAGAGAVFVGIWIFLSGGILDRLARARPIRASAFFSACGGYFLRFMRLGLVIGACYWAIFRWLAPFLLGTSWNRWTRDLTSETVSTPIRLALYGMLAAALFLVGVLADFARVRAVVEDRRSMIGALVASFRFIRRRWWRIGGLYAVNLATAVSLGALWTWADPNVSRSPWLAFGVGQLYVAARIAAHLAFMASGVVFFQRELAPAPSKAASQPTWPDSPAVESVQ